jgi:hypothetical protein
MKINKVNGEKKILPFIISLASGGSVHQLWPGRAPSGVARPTSEQGLRHRAPAWWHGRPPPGASAAEIRQGPVRPNSGRGGIGDLRQGRYMGELHQGWRGRPPSGAARLISVQGDLGQAAVWATSVRRRRRPSSVGGGHRAQAAARATSLWDGKVEHQRGWPAAGRGSLEAWRVAGGGHAGYVGIFSLFIYFLRYLDFFLFLEIIRIFKYADM